MNTDAQYFGFALYDVALVVHIWRKHKYSRSFVINKVIM